MPSCSSQRKMSERTLEQQITSCFMWRLIKVLKCFEWNRWFEGNREFVHDNATNQKLISKRKDATLALLKWSKVAQTFQVGVSGRELWCKKWADKKHNKQIQMGTECTFGQSRIGCRGEPWSRKSWKDMIHIKLCSFNIILIDLCYII